MKIPLSWISLYTPLAEVLEKYTTKALAHEYSIHTAEIGLSASFLKSSDLLVSKFRDTIEIAPPGPIVGPSLCLGVQGAPAEVAKVN